MRLPIDFGLIRGVSSTTVLFAAGFVDVGRYQVEEGPDLQGGGFALVVETAKRHDIPVEVIGNVLLNMGADFRQKKTICLRTITGNLTAKFLPMVKPTAAMALVITGAI
ncbi:MAG: hypothetical protein ABSF34_15785 [Verrucomicrobiota bacterium]